MKRYISLLGLVAMLTNCKPNNAQPTISPTGCVETSPVIRQATDLAGVVTKSPDQSLYAISYSVPGTYDSVWLGFACNLPEEYKVEGKQVVFSGAYRTGPTGGSFPAGTERYYLTLTSVRVK